MTCSCILLLSVRWSQSSHSLSGATQFGMWVAMQGDSGPITHNTMLLTLRVSMSSHRPVRSLPLCKCPINFLCNNAKATKSDHGNLPKHVARSSKICRSKPKWQGCLSKLVFISRLLLLKQLVRFRVGFSVALFGFSVGYFQMRLSGHWI